MMAIAGTESTFDVRAFWTGLRKTFQGDRRKRDRVLRKAMQSLCEDGSVDGEDAENIRRTLSEELTRLSETETEPRSMDTD